MSRRINRIALFLCCLLVGAVSFTCTYFLIDDSHGNHIQNARVVDCAPLEASLRDHWREYYAIRAELSVVSVEVLNSQTFLYDPQEHPISSTIDKLLLPVSKSNFGRNRRLWKRGDCSDVKIGSHVMVLEYEPRGRGCLDGSPESNPEMEPFTIPEILSESVRWYE